MVKAKNTKNEWVRGYLYYNNEVVTAHNNYNEDLSDLFNTSYKYQKIKPETICRQLFIWNQVEYYERDIVSFKGQNIELSLKNVSYVLEDLSNLSGVLGNTLDQNSKNIMLTKEQEQIVYSNGDITVNAFAGTGKTTTIIEYVRARPTNCKFLYLVFNKSIKNEAIEKFKNKGIENIVVETAHSLAFRSIVMGSKYKVSSSGLSVYDVVKIFAKNGTNGNANKNFDYIIASHVLKFIAMFCNSDKATISELNYLTSIDDHKSRIFVSTHYKQIESQTRALLSKMNNAEIEISHDFYLKKYQLSKPQLNYDYILFDEGQDASESILDVFKNQKASKVIVGDSHQQIYSWRYAVNSLQKTNFKNLYLSNSFRFHQDIADLANVILSYKNFLKIVPPELTFNIKGQGKSTEIKSFAILGRTNIGLLHRAISYIKQKPNTFIYFEGNISSYTYADEGASLFDVYYLSVGKNEKIKDSLIKQMSSMGELKDYVELTADKQLGMMMDIIADYGNDIFDILAELKSRHLPDNQKQNASVVFSTVHKAKGQEYDCVELVKDFITEESIYEIQDKLQNGVGEDEKPVNITKVNEEINMLYVAVTRAKVKVIIPDVIKPSLFTPKTSLIEVIKYEKK